MGESMAADAIAMGLDLTIAPDGQEWSESIYERPRINREIWGGTDDSDMVFGKKISLDRNESSSFFDCEESTNDNLIPNNILKVSNSNYYFIKSFDEAVKFAKYYQPSIFKIANHGEGYFVYLSPEVDLEIDCDFMDNDEVQWLMPKIYIKETVLKTMFLLIDNLSVKDIALARGLTDDTIVQHIKELAVVHGLFFDYLKPCNLLLNAVQKAIQQIESENNPFKLLCDGSVRLKNIFELLDNDFFKIDFVDIQLAIVFLEKQEVFSDDDLPF